MTLTCLHTPEKGKLFVTLPLTPTLFVGGPVLNCVINSIICFFARFLYQLV